MIFERVIAALQRGISLDEINIDNISSELDRIRKEIATIDLLIVRLLADRIHLAADAALVKSELRLPLRDVSVEEDVVKRMVDACNEHSVDPTLVKEIASRIISHSLEIQKRITTRKN